METATATNGQTAGSTLSGGPSRPLAFDEMGEKDQIQALRREARIMRELVNSQQQVIDRLIKHSHAADGTLMVPAFETTNRGFGGRQDPLA